MNINIKMMAAMLAAAGVGLSACNDLDTLPDSQYVSTVQKEEAIASRPDLGTAGVVGIASTYKQYGNVYGTTNLRHLDFGWSSVMLLFDSMGTDLVGLDTGYNWFSSASEYDLGDNNNYVNNMLWYNAYEVILAANSVLSNISADTEDPELQLYAAQGYANRAYMYFWLAQAFQNTYKGNESLPCVPVLTNENADQAAADGCARATVQEVYDQILSDLDKAIDFLTASGLSTSKIADTGAKRFVSLGAAYGLRARVYLVMNEWAKAAADARAAINYSGATPSSIADASKPSFWTCDESDWMWGIYIEENDRIVTSGIVNFPSHMGSLNYGYATVGAWRKVNVALYDWIPDTDARKGWWLDADGVSANLTASQQAYTAACGAPGYTQVKFAPYQNIVDQTNNASDIPLMRVEEMYLIEAEALAMGGDVAGGKTALETFVKTYRNPAYQCPASDGKGVQEAVWMQRRVELWGEGMAYFDLLRLGKGIDRRGGGWESQWCYNVPAPLKPLLIPNGEMETNALIVSNNDTWSKPNAVDDY